jgi:outer membrane protein TolC
MRKLLVASIYVCISLAAVAAVCFAQTSGSVAVLRLDLNEAVKRALETSEELKIKDNDVVKRQGIYREARSGLLPHISANSSWTHNPKYPASAELTDYQLSGGISASQLLFSFGKVGSAVSSAKQAVEAARFSRDAGRQDVIYAAKLSCYSIVLARNSYTIAESSY